MLHTPLYARHVAAGGKIIDFGGWALPVQYKGGILDEHRWVRSAAGLFDVSHMGEVRFRGAGAEAAVQRVITNDVGRLRDGAAIYTCVCLPSGGIVDDCIVYRHAGDDFLIVVNASNAAKDFAWFCEQARAHVGDRCAVTDESSETALLAVQGPKAIALVASAGTSSDAIPKLPSFHFLRSDVAGVACTIARTGYTGEDGCEIFCAPADAARLWDALIASSAGTLRPIGLGARDTLRLEARLSLYGNDIDEEHTPHEAGLSWVVKGKGFVGEDALAKQLAAGPTRKLVGFVMKERGIARHGYPIVDGSGKPIGVVTSGTTGPTVEAAIGLGYVPTGAAAVGASLIVDCRGKPARSEIVKGAFYKREIK
jgi:aminomethyltransferase